MYFYTSDKKIDQIKIVFDQLIFLNKYEYLGNEIIYRTNIFYKPPVSSYYRSFERISRNTSSSFLLTKYNFRQNKNKDKQRRIIKNFLSQVHDFFQTFKKERIIKTIILIAISLTNINNRLEDRVEASKE